MRFFTDTASGKDFERKGIQKAKREAISNYEVYDYFLVWCWDRLGRNALQSLQFLEELAQHKIEVNSVKEWIDKSQGQTLGMLGFFLGTAEGERKKISQRTIAALDVLKSKGYYTGSIPFGYKKAEKLDFFGRKIMEIDYGKAEIIQYVFNEFSTGLFSQSQLRENTDRIFGKGSISRSVLSRVLRSPIYYGGVPIYDKSRMKSERRKIVEIVEGKHTPIIRKELFDECQTVLKERTSKKYGKNNKKGNQFFLKGYLKCPTCKRYLTASYSLNRSGNRYDYYLCLNKCKEARVQVLKMHNVFFQLLKELSFDFKTVQNINLEIVEMIGRTNNANSSHISDLTDELVTLITNKKHLERNLTEYCPKMFSKLYQSICVQIDTAQNEKLIYSNELLEEISFDDQRLYKVFKDLRWTIRNGDINFKKKLIEFLFPNGFTYYREQEKIIAKDVSWLLKLGLKLKSKKK